MKLRSGSGAIFPCRCSTFLVGPPFAVRIIFASRWFIAIDKRPCARRDRLHRMQGAQMMKTLIPILTIALVGNAVATAQWVGPGQTSVVGSGQASRPIRLARAFDNELVPSPSDTPKSLDSLESLDALEPPASLDIPEALELPNPSATSTLENTDTDGPRTSSEELEALQPSDTPRSILEPFESNGGAELGMIDFDNAFDQQQRDRAAFDLHNRAAQYYGGGAVAWSPQAAGGCGGCQTSLPYRAPVLPPSNSFYGYFRANACYADIWANYPAEAAAACAHNRAMMAPAAPIMRPCNTCELVAPKTCR